MPRRSRCSRLRACSVHSASSSGRPPGRGRAGVQLHRHRLLRPVRVQAAQVRAAGQPQVHVPAGVRQAVLADHPVQPCLRERPPLGQQRVDRVHHVRPVQQLGGGQLTHHRGRLAVPAAHRLGQQPANRHRVLQDRHRVRQGPRDRGHRQARDLLRDGQVGGAHDPGAARRTQPAQPRHQHVERLQGRQRGSGGESVQGQRGQAGDHRLAVGGGGRLVPPRLHRHAHGALPRRVQQHRVQPLLARRRSGVEQDDTGQQLLPGPAGTALLAGLGGRDAVGPQLRVGQDTTAGAGAGGEVVQGARGEGVLWFMTGNFPPPDGLRTPVTRSSTNPDKPALKDACSDTETPGPFG